MFAAPPSMSKDAGSELVPVSEAAAAVAEAGRAQAKRRKVEVVHERQDDEFGNAGDGEDGGGAAAHGAHAGGWATGGLGDRTGVG